MITVEINTTYSTRELLNAWPEDMYINDPIGVIKQMILEEMIMQTLPMKITIDNEIETENANST